MGASAFHRCFALLLSRDLLFLDRRDLVVSVTWVPEKSPRFMGPFLAPSSAGARRKRPARVLVAVVVLLGELRDSESYCTLPGCGEASATATTAKLTVTLATTLTLTLTLIITLTCDR